MQHGDVDIPERDPDRLEGSREVRGEDYGQPVAAATLTKPPRLLASSRGQAPGLPSRRDSILVVLGRGVGLEDEIDVHG
jgi:hypothetical protein